MSYEGNQTMKLVWLLLHVQSLLVLFEPRWVRFQGRTRGNEVDMQRRANYHPHTRAHAFYSEPLGFKKHKKHECAQSKHAKFVQAIRKKQVSREKQAELQQQQLFATSRVELEGEQVVLPKTVFVQVERPGSGVIVCTAKVLVDTPDIFDQLTSQITAKLNNPYGKERQGRFARPWVAQDFDLFCGHNFDDLDLLSKDFRRARFQVCCLAHTNTPLVVVRKRGAKWVDVEVRQKDLKARIVRDVRPKSHAHILWSCFPDGKHHKDYKIMIDNIQDCRSTLRGHVWDASSRVVVEPWSENVWASLRFDATLFRRLQHSVARAATEARHQDFRFLEDLNAYRLEWRNFFRAMFE